MERFVDVGADRSDVDTVVFNVHDEALKERGQEVASGVACEAGVKISWVLEEVDVGEYSFGAPIPLDSAARPYVRGFNSQRSPFDLFAM